jgi:hypothetical protein
MARTLELDISPFFYKIETGIPQPVSLVFWPSVIIMVLVIVPPPLIWKRRPPGNEPNPLNLQNSFVAAINISLFTKLDTYEKHIDNLIDGLKTLPAAEGFSEIFVLGEPEDRTYEGRSRNGIPLPEGTVHNLRNAAEKFGINLPPGLSG